MDTLTSLINTLTAYVDLAVLLVGIGAALLYGFTRIDDPKADKNGNLIL